MNNLLKFNEFWYEKLFLGIFVTAFAPFKVSIMVLAVFIVIDTGLGAYYAVKVRKFTSKGFRKGINKITAYFLVITVIRLLEIGIHELFQTVLLTRIVISYLIITESISILENLVLLNVPIPAGFLKKLIDNIKNKLFGGWSGNEEKDYMKEIDDIINYQIPILKSEKMQRMLIIKFKEWKNTLATIDEQITEAKSDNSDLIFLRVVTIINATNVLINQKWDEEQIPKTCIDAFNKWHGPRIERWIQDIKDICYSGDKVEKKKQRIIVRTMVILYQTIIDIQKGEFSIAYAASGKL